MDEIFLKTINLGNSLVIQWLRLCTSHFCRGSSLVGKLGSHMPYRVAKKREDYQPFFLPNILEKYIFTVAVTKGVILGGMWVKSPTSDLPVCIFSSHFLLFSISIFTKQHFNNISQYSLRSNSGLGSVLNHLCVSINLSYNRERISDGENCSLERFSHT